jgi:hypothetical protein
MELKKLTRDDDHAAMHLEISAFSPFGWCAHRVLFMFGDAERILAAGRIAVHEVARLEPVEAHHEEGQ